MDSQMARQYARGMMDNGMTAADAYARLIAAAPDMLEALKGILASFHESVTTAESLAEFPALQAVANAITKAETGELTQ
jgi:hypothetical protein